MSFDSHLKRIRQMAVTSMAAALVVVMLPAAATAQTADTLARYLPEDTQLVAGLNVTKLRTSRYYAQALEWLRDGAGPNDVVNLLEQDAGIDLSDDVDSVLVSLPNTNLSRDLQRHFTVAMAGQIDKAKLIAAIKKENENVTATKIGTLKVYATDTIELGFPAEGIIVATAGPAEYKKKMWAGVKKQDIGLPSDAQFERLMGKIDTTRGFWMLGDTSKMDATDLKGAPKASSDVKPKSLAVTLDIVDGLDLDLLAELGSEKDAKSLVAQIEALKKTGSQKAILSIMGAGPLVENLTAKQDANDLRANSTMTAAQFDVMVRRLKQLAKSRINDGQNAPAASGTSDAPPKDQNGADADFN